MNDETTPAAADPRGSSVIDVAAKTLTLTASDGTTATYNLANLPADVAVFMTARGVALRLSKHADPAAAWAELVAGKLPSERSAKPKEKSIGDQAIALALRDEIAKARDVKKNDKAGFAALLEEAAKVVEGMDKAKKAAARETAAVLSYIASLKAASAPQTSLLDLAA